jgi:hypothetical protein
MSIKSQNEFGRIGYIRILTYLFWIHPLKFISIWRGLWELNDKLVAPLFSEPKVAAWFVLV